MTDCGEDNKVTSYHSIPTGDAFPTLGYSDFYYYANGHWDQFGRDGTACGPAAACTAARFQRGADLCPHELESAKPNLGLFGTTFRGMTNMLDALGVEYGSEWISGGRTEYIKSIRQKLQERASVIVMVDWPGVLIAHLMVAFGATDKHIYFTNYTNDRSPLSKTSFNHKARMSDETLHGHLSGILVTLGGFSQLNYRYHLLYVRQNP